MLANLFTIQRLLAQQGISSAGVNRHSSTKVNVAIPVYTSSGSDPQGSLMLWIVCKLSIVCTVSIIWNSLFELCNWLPRSHDMVSVPWLDDLTFLDCYKLSWLPTAYGADPGFEEVQRILFLWCLAGVSCAYAQDPTDSQIWGQEGMFSLGGVFAFLCSMEHRSLAKVIRAYPS